MVKALAEAHETGELSKTLVKTVKLEILSTSEKQIDAGFQKFESKIEPMVSKIIEGEVNKIGAILISEVSKALLSVIDGKMTSITKTIRKVIKSEVDEILKDLEEKSKSQGIGDSSVLSSNRIKKK